MWQVNGGCPGAFQPPSPTHWRRVLAFQNSNAMPPRMATEANTKRQLSCSPKMMTPPNEDMTGTASCAVAVVVDFSDGKTACQTEYPSADASAPDKKASVMPAMLKLKW